MADLTKTIEAKSDQLNSDDLMAGGKTVKITKVSLLAEDQQPIAINYEGDNDKPFKPCKSMRRVLVLVWGGDGNKFIGRSMTLYRDEKVTFGGQAVGGIRISHMSDIDKPKTMSLTATRMSKKPYTVHPLKDGAPAASKPTEDRVPDSVVEKCMENGEANARQGVAAYKKWLSGLDDKIKAKIKHKHKEWSALAKEADEPKEEEIPL